MHTDPIPVEGRARGSRRMRGSLNQQGDGRKPLPHLVTGLLSIAVTLLVGHLTHVAQGPQGVPGVTSIITKAGTGYGVCFSYNPHATTARQRFVITSPVADAAGAYCKKGTLISVVPGKP